MCADFAARRHLSASPPERDFDNDPESLLIDPIFQANRPAVQIDNAAADRQAQTAPGFLILSSALIDPDERFEYFL